MNSNTICQTIVDISQKAYDNKLFAGTSGNLSFYDRNDEKIYITPTSIRYDVMTVEDIVVINLRGDIISGIRKPSSEWRMHVQIYKDMGNVNAVFHTHSPYATAFACVYRDIPPILVEMNAFLGGDIKVAPFAKAGTAEVGINCALSLKDRGGCLMGNHGVVAIGSDIDEAYLRAEYIEEAACIYHKALLIGTPREINNCV